MSSLCRSGNREKERQFYEEQRKEIGRGGEGRDGRKDEVGGQRACVVWVRGMDRAPMEVMSQQY